MNYFVYGLYIKGEQKPFYVGKTYKGSGRLSRHKRSPKHDNTMVSKKIKNLESNGIKWYMRVLKYFKTEEESVEIEIKLIKLLGKKWDDTGILYNVTNGGDGADGTKHTQEWKDNFRARLMEKFNWDLDKIEEMKKLYIEEEKSLKEIAEIYNLKAPAVRRMLKYVGMEFRSDTETRKLNAEKYRGSRWDENENAEMVKLYKEGKSIYEIAPLFDITATEVRNRIKYAGVVLRNRKDSILVKGLKNNRTAFKKYEYLLPQIKILYEDKQMSTREVILELKLDIGETCLNRRMKKFGIKIRSRKDAVKLVNEKVFSDDIVKFIISKYKEGESTISIGEELNISKDSVYKILRENGVEIRHKSCGIVKHRKELVASLK